MASTNGNGTALATPETAQLTLPSLIRGDGAFINFATGINVEGVDKAASARARPRKYLRQVEADRLYGSSDIAAKIVDTIPKDMTRKWYKLQLADSDGKKKIEKAIATAAEFDKYVQKRLKSRTKLCKALRYSRLYGGSLAILGVDDGREAHEPVDEKKIRKIDFINVLSRWRVGHITINQDPYSENYGEPEVYHFETGPHFGEDKDKLPASKQQIHRSRVLRFDGMPLGEDDREREDWWGISVLERAYDHLANYDQSIQVLPNKIADSIQSVYKIKNLNQVLATPATDDVDSLSGIDQLRRHYHEMEYCRSILHAVVVDLDNAEWDVKVASGLGQLAALIERLKQRLVAACDGIPSMLIFGEEVKGGMGPSGPTMLRSYYDRVSQDQEDMLREPLEYQTRLVLLAKDGPTKGKEPDEWDIAFNPLWQESEGEILERRLKQSQLDTAYYGIVDDTAPRVLGAQEIRANRFGNPEFSHETSLEEIELPKPDEEDDEGKDVDPAKATLIKDVIAGTHNGDWPVETGIKTLAFLANIEEDHAKDIIGEVEEEDDSDFGFPAGTEGVGEPGAGEAAPPGEEPAAAESTPAEPVPTEQEAIAPPGEATPDAAATPAAAPPPDQTTLDSIDVIRVDGGWVFTDSIRLDRKGKKRNCTIGQSCGETCISWKTQAGKPKVCHIKPPPKEKQAIATLAQSIAQTLKGTKAGQAVTQATQTATAAGQAVGQAVEQAKETAQQAGQAVTQTAQKARQAVETAKSSQAAKTAGQAAKAAGQAAKAVGQAARRAAESPAAQRAKEALRRARESERGKQAEHALEHLGENVIAWKTGKVLGAAVGGMLQHQGFDPEMAGILGETAVQGVTATALALRNERNRKPRRVAEIFIGATSAALVGKLAHTKVEALPLGENISHRVTQTSAILAGKISGLTTHSAATKAVSGFFDRHGEALAGILDRVARFDAVDAGLGVPFRLDEEDGDPQFSQLEQEAIADLMVAALMIVREVEGNRRAAEEAETAAADEEADDGIN